MRTLALTLLFALAASGLAHAGTQEPSFGQEPKPAPSPSPAPEATAAPLFPDATPTPEPTPDPATFTDPMPVEPTPTATPAPGATPAPTPTASPAKGSVEEILARIERDRQRSRKRGFESPKWYSAEIGGAGLQLDGDIAKRVYGDEYEATLHSRFGVLLFSILDLGLSADFTQITARRLGSNDGARSAEVTRLTLVPLAATAILRLDFFPNQPLVPYGGAGYAYLVWSERNPIEDDQIDGDKQGVVLFGGVQILLDFLEPARAQDRFVVGRQRHLPRPGSREDHLLRQRRHRRPRPRPPRSPRIIPLRVLISA